MYHMYVRKKVLQNSMLATLRVHMHFLYILFVIIICALIQLCICWWRLSFIEILDIRTQKINILGLTVTYPDSFTDGTQQVTNLIT